MIILFKYWNVKFITKTSSMRRWNEYCDGKSIEKMPIPSQIRWGYHFDIINYIKCNYDKIIDFMSNKEIEKMFTEHLNSKKKKPNFLNKQFGVEVMKTAEYKAVLIAFNEILEKARELIDSLQDREGFIDQKFISIQNHIEYIYNCIGNLNSYPSFFNNRCLFDYAIFCSYVEVNTLYTNNVIRGILQQYLVNLFLKFTDINTKLTVINLENYTTFEKYKQQVDEVNKDNQLYLLIELIINYSKFDYSVPQGLDDRVKNDYVAFIGEVKNTFTQSNSIIKDLITLRNGSNKYDILFSNLMATMTCLPTSCSVESLFSFMKNVEHINMGDFNVEASVKIVMRVRGHQMKEFERK